MDIKNRVIAQWGVFKFSADATKCAEEIVSHLPENFQAKELVDLARDPGTELHKCFEWDDTIAAEKYRIRQAMDVSRSIQITYVDNRSHEPETKSVRMFYNNGRGTGYQSVVRMVTVDDEYAKLLEQAKKEMSYFKQRYSTILEVRSVIDAIDEALNG